MTFLPLGPESPVHPCAPAPRASVQVCAPALPCWEPRPRCQAVANRAPGFSGYPEPKAHDSSELGPASSASLQEPAWALFSSTLFSLVHPFPWERTAQQWRSHQEGVSSDCLNSLGIPINPAPWSHFPGSPPGQGTQTCAQSSGEIQAELLSWVDSIPCSLGEDWNLRMRQERALLTLHWDAVPNKTGCNTGANPHMARRWGPGPHLSPAVKERQAISG